MDKNSLRLQQWISIFNDSCDITNSNCYDTIDSVIDKITKKPPIKQNIEGMDNFIKKFKNMLIKNSIHHNCNAYRIDILIKDKVYNKITKRERSTNVFNHSFMVLQCQDKMTLYDSWEGIHFRTSRKIVNWGDFLKWINKLNFFLNKASNENVLEYIHSLFVEDPFAEEVFIKKQFEKEKEKMLEEGQWTQDWPEIYIKNLTERRKIDINLEWFPLF